MKIQSLQRLRNIVFLCSFCTSIGIFCLTHAADSQITNANPSATSGAGPGLLSKAGDWRDPENILPEVIYDGLPIQEVAAHLKDQFHGAFDVIFPYASGDRGLNWSETTVSLMLRNVKASEIFNAMNLAWESGHTPLHWELTMNGHRPTVLLQLLPHATQSPPAIDPATGLPVSAPKPMVFFVGDLVGDAKSGRMSMETLAKTIAEICRFGLQGDHVSCYDPAQLLIVRGTPEEIGFVQSTLAALREKALLDAQKAFAREHGGDESSFWPQQWTRQQDAMQQLPESGAPGAASAPSKTKATNQK